jgi:hypothetical protein
VERTFVGGPAAFPATAQQTEGIEGMVDLLNFDRHVGGERKKMLFLSF